MKRKHTLNDFQMIDHTELSRKTAIHEAGHAAAIYFGNKQRMLPPVFFQIVIHNCDCSSLDPHCTAKIEGGRLIHTLPSSFEEATRGFSLAQQQAYQQAFEADIVNLLVGSLAEAYYVAQQDNELINPHLVPLHALPNYGGAADLVFVQQYLQCFIPESSAQEHKINELFWSAFEFINDWAHWYAISALAHYILQQNKEVIEYEEVADILESHLSIVNKRRLAP